MDLSINLNFNGECENALNFYKKVFNAKDLQLMYFKDMPRAQFPAEFGKGITHGELIIKEGLTIMASDTFPDRPVTFGQNTTLALNFTNKDEEEKIFNALSEGGKVTMPLEKAFWGAYFGMLTDKFGVQWMFNCMI